MKKVLFTLLALSALASCKKNDLPNSSSPNGEKEIVRLSLSGGLSGARELILTPKEVGGKIKIETKVTDKTLPVQMQISESGGTRSLQVNGSLQIADDGKSFRFAKDVDITGLKRPFKLSMYYYYQGGDPLQQKKLYKFDKTKPISLPVAFTSFGNNLVEEVDPHGNRSLVARNISVSLAGFIMRIKFKNETGKDYVIKSIRSNSLTPSGFYYDGSSNKQSLRVETETVQQKFDGNESGIVLRNGETTDEYLMYCAATTNQITQAAMSLDVEPTDGVYDQAVFTDFGRALPPPSSIGKIVTRTVKLRELKSPLTYFDSKMVGQTPTTAVTPEVTFTSFQDKAPVHVNMGYYDRTEVNQINVSGYHIPSEYEWEGLLPGIGTWSSTMRSVTFPIRLRADRVLYKRVGHTTSVPGSDEAVNKDYYAPVPSNMHDMPTIRPIQVGDRVFEYGDVSFVRGGAESIPIQPWVKDNRPGISTDQDIIPPSLPILEDPSKKLVIYGLTLGGEYRLNGVNVLASASATDRPGYKVVRLLNSSARYAYKYTVYRDRAIIETCPVGGDPSIKTAADVRDKNLFTTSSRVLRREIRYVPSDNGVSKRNGDFVYLRRGAQQTIFYPPITSGDPVQYTYTAPEYPLIYLHRGITWLPNIGGYSVENNASIFIGMRDDGNSFHKRMPRVTVKEYNPDNVKYPVWLIKNAD